MTWIGSPEERRYSALLNASERAYRAHRRRPRFTTADRINGLGDAAFRRHQVFMYRRRALIETIRDARSTWS